MNEIHLQFKDLQFTRTKLIPPINQLTSQPINQLTSQPVNQLTN
jgi:hypothetical protein